MLLLTYTQCKLELEHRNQDQEVKARKLYSGTNKPANLLHQQDEVFFLG